MRNCRAQFRQSEVVRIERFAITQRSGSGIADDSGRDLVAFAKPELEHVGAPEASIGDLANHGFFEV